MIRTHELQFHLRIVTVIHNFPIMKYAPVMQIQIKARTLNCLDAVSELKSATTGPPHQRLRPYTACHQILSCPSMSLPWACRVVVQGENYLGKEILQPDKHCALADIFSYLLPAAFAPLLFDFDINFSE